jgi:hypothetical protein
METKTRLRRLISLAWPFVVLGVFFLVGLLGHHLSTPRAE